MELTTEIRRSLIQNLSPVQLFLYRHPNSGLTLFSIAKNYNLAEGEKYTQFVTTVGDIVLGFYKIEDTVPLLQQELGIDATTAGLLGADVLEFLAPLSDPNFVVPADEAEEGDTVMAQPVDTTTPTSHGAATFYIPPTNGAIPVTMATPAVPVDTIPHMEPIRTMAGDMARSPERASYEPLTEPETPVYSSKQPEVRTPLSDLPAYTSNPTPKPNTPAPAAGIETPRWGA